MILLKTVTMLALAGAAGFFLIYLTALETGSREDRRLGRASFLDETGSALTVAARSAFFAWIGFLVLLTLFDAVG
ncbi:hypothetical protein NUH88_09330 [Nisaea acidiphila]|uniref:Uncharacterized protein n=1 Tax=Nisaea acidiphila TaxID=1862145 RepID=A0A9J7AX82_9PROT|nr:hypothetical protein [Nisaea acidiphila]UUX51888.1 hypothetical protein NUH88_09330 [Nisaea acidiphila]